MSRYETLVQTVRKKYPNLYKRHYIEHAESASLPQRINTANDLAIELRNHFIDQQPSGYKASQKPRAVYLPLKTTDHATEIMTDYILAEDHVRGLKRQRDASVLPGMNEEYPPLGKGARDYLERYNRYRPENPKRVKICEGCQSYFYDESAKNKARVCSDECRRLKDALRKRKEYNVTNLGISDETRRKADRRRQDYDYPFYNPQELYELESRSEKSFEPSKMEQKAFKHDKRYDKWRLNGRRKPMYVGRDEFDPKDPFIYSPPDRYGTGNERDWQRKAGPVITRKLSEVSPLQLEGEKWVNSSLKLRATRVLPTFNSEIFAVK
ncbi:hypothetical protein [Priestia koreensis]|uniref:hypothetical protein n=1 Tax=Priestia koreensis TaxID=284581 RepID=UPI003018EDED